MTIVEFLRLVQADARRYSFKMKPRSRLGQWFLLIFFIPGFQLALSIRLQALVIRIPLVGIPLRRIIWYFSSIITATEVMFGVKIGEGIYFPHPTGIVIRGECIIGNNVLIGQGVTIGRRAEEDDDSITVIEDGCRIHAGAKILGNVRIGRGAVVGCNAVVLQDVPESTTAVGVPARIIGHPKRSGAATE